MKTWEEFKKEMEDYRPSWLESSYYRVKRVVTDVPYFLAHCWQKLTRGFSYRDLWSLDYTIAKFTLPRLEAFAKHLHGYPGSLDSLEEWQEIIGKMVIAHKLHIEDMGGGRCITTAEREMVEEGFDLFHEYYFSLWD